MTNTDVVIEFLRDSRGLYCDDCLSIVCYISSRQAVNQICNQLLREDKILRKKNKCIFCSKDKLTNSYKGVCNGVSEESIENDNLTSADKENNEDILLNEYDLSLECTLTEFFRYVLVNQIEIYNEFSLQHELGIFLKNYYSNIYRVEFERNVEFFGINKEETIKKEIDISLVSNSNDEKICIELKCPTNGQYPEQMYSFCKDIKFLEQLVVNGFSEGYFIALVDSDIYIKDKGISSNKIYEVFRVNKLIRGVINKPTGETNEKIEILGEYGIVWRKLSGNRYFTIIKISNT